MPADMDGLDHVVGGVVRRRMICREAGKRRSRELLVAYAGFSKITVAAQYAVDQRGNPVRAGVVRID